MNIQTGTLPSRKYVEIHYTIISNKITLKHNEICVIINIQLQSRLEKDNI